MEEMLKLELELTTKALENARTALDEIVKSSRDDIARLLAHTGLKASELRNIDIDEY